MEMTTTQELLAQAEKLCSQRNVRLTPQRLEVLRLMSLPGRRYQCLRSIGFIARIRTTSQTTDGLSCTGFSAGAGICT